MTPTRLSVADLRDISARASEPSADRRVERARQWPDDPMEVEAGANRCAAG